MELEGRVKNDARYDVLRADVATFWRQAIKGLEVREARGRGQGIFVAEPE